MGKSYSNRGFWLVDQNPHNLPEPPQWWQRLVLDHDKMLRIMPSAVQRCYRLCRVARRDAQLGLNLIGQLHQHPDTQAMVKFGVVPELTLAEHAVRDTRITALLRSRDTWHLYGGDPDKRLAAIRREEAEQQAVRDREHEAQWDEVLSDSFRHVKEGYRTQIEPNSKARAAGLLKPLPLLPDRLPRSLTAPPVAF